MNDLMRELRLFLRLRSAVLAILALFILAAAGVACGLSEVARERAVIDRIPAKQASDVAAVAAWASKAMDPGDAAYYTFHHTFDPPSDLSFAAIGMRDAAPYILRVRALGLEAQLYESEISNPESLLPGRFDFAFVLVYLAPLFVILLFHDLRSGEREAGRLGALEASVRSTEGLWRARTVVRYAALAAALAIPFLGGALLASVAAWKVAAVLAVILLYLAFWTALTLIVARAARSSLANAMTLAAAWLVLTLLAPAAGHVGVNAAIPLSQGSELSLKQRDVVHEAWDIPKSRTMDAFYKSHPEWADSPPLGQAFHWKWYFAFHQVGDESVAGLARAYRDGILQRSAWADGLGFVLPGVAAQGALHRLAGTDPAAQIAYLDRVRAYHAKLRQFYYAFMFTDRPFEHADFDRAPVFAPPAGDAPRLPWMSLLALFLGAATAGLLAVRAVRRGS